MRGGRGEYSEARGRKFGFLIDKVGKGVFGVVTGRSETRPPVSRRARGEGEAGGWGLGYFLVGIGDFKCNGGVEKKRQG